MDKLSELMRLQKYIIILDIDNFKKINHTSIGLNQYENGIGKEMFFEGVDAMHIKLNAAAELYHRERCT